MTLGQAVDTVDILETEERQTAEDIAFLTENILKTGGPALDLGCGAGRLAIPIARGGIEVVGLDISAPMLARFRRKLSAEPSDVRKRVMLIQGDIRRFSLKRRFRCAFFSSNTLFLLGSEATIAEALACVRLHLKSDGVLIVDVAAVDSQTRAALKEYPKGDVPDLDLLQCCNGYSIRRSHCIEPQDLDDHEAPRRIAISYKYFDASDNLCFERREDVTLLSPEELLLLVETLGYEITETFGWYDGRAYAGGERRLIVIARRKE